MLAGGVGRLRRRGRERRGRRATAAAAGDRELGVGPDDAVVGIAASGRTPYVLGAIEAASARRRAHGRRRLQPRHAARRASRELPIEVLVGPEIVAGSTRLNAGTAQKVVLNIISTVAMIQLGKTYGGLMVDLRATNAKLRDRATRIVAEIAGVPREQARAALEACDWSAKSAAAMLARRERPRGRAASCSSGTTAGCAPRSRSSAPPRPPGPGPDSRRLGVARRLRRRRPRQGRRRGRGRNDRRGRPGGRRARGSRSRRWSTFR